MDFEDEFDIQHDAYDDDDDYNLYSGGDDADADADMDCVEEADDSNDHMVSHRHEQNYAILTEADIHQRQEDEITRTSTVLSISKVAATILLRHYNWNDVSKVHDEWFADEEKVRSVVGLMEKKPPNNNNKNVRQVVTCGICFEAYDRRMHTSAANCGHPFCNTCWTCYISTAIHDGPGCLMLRCPEPSCSAAVGHDMIRSLASAEDMERYSRYLIRSYVEHSRKIKWCPAPGCEHAVDFVIGSSGRNYDVTCRCSYSFCWNCTEDAHRPVDCGTVAKWTLKNSSESENTTWILAKTKPCPKCKRPIEKNQGCMHMSCGAPCGFHFCWLCLGAWSDHNLKTGDGYFSCNRYETQRKEGLYDEEDKRREKAEKSLQKYTHYYERWATNQSSWQKAMADLEKMQTVNLEQLSDIHGVPVIWLEFITEAWLQIIECRRVLKWTYAYGYYLPDHEDAKRQLFEYLQGQAESWLERLHQCAEKELQGYLDAERSSQEFDEFRSKLAGLTGVTRNYFENLVRALENGLSDVNSSSKNLGRTSSKWRFGRGSRNINDWDRYWSCEHCTFANVKTAEICQMCFQLR